MSDSKHSATAMVETLTAEVRVVMVGNRQITQSVAKQLDRVGLDELSIFGRVKVTIDGHDEHVIGRRIGGSDLVLASFDSYARARICVVDLGGIASEIGGSALPVMCGRSSGRGRSQRLDFYGTEVIIPDMFMTYRNCGPAYCECVAGWDARGSLGEIRRQVNEWSEVEAARVARNTAASKTPLIVLAGLR